jgi:hypothetical protein
MARRGGNPDLLKKVVERLAVQQLTSERNSSARIPSSVRDVGKWICVKQHQISHISCRLTAARSRPKYAAGFNVVVLRAFAGVIPPRTKASSSSCTHESAIMPSQPVKI